MAGPPIPALPILAVATVAFLGFQRLAELAYAVKANRRLAALGAIPIRPDGYAAIVAVHATWLAAILAESAWLGVATGWWTWVGIALFVAGAFLRYSSMAALGDRWSTRVWVLPHAPLVRAGPYRFLRHPIYVGVSLELVAAPLALGLWWTAAAVTVLNAAAVWNRIRIEETSLRLRPA